MKRRDFFKTLAMATVGFSILPPAKTYQRIWKASPILARVNPEWANAPYEVSFLFDPSVYAGEWKWLQKTEWPDNMGSTRRFVKDNNGIFREVIAEKADSLCSELNREFGFT